MKVGRVNLNIEAFKVLSEKEAKEHLKAHGLKDRQIEEVLKKTHAKPSPKKRILEK